VGREHSLEESIQASGPSTTVTCYVTLGKPTPLSGPQVLSVVDGGGDGDGDGSQHIRTAYFVPGTLLIAL
jgi:hypothetical protein